MKGWCTTFRWRVAFSFITSSLFRVYMQGVLRPFALMLLLIRLLLMLLLMLLMMQHDVRLLLLLVLPRSLVLSGVIVEARCVTVGNMTMPEDW